VPRQQKQITPSEIEALLRRHERIKAAGGNVPRAFEEKYERLERIVGDPAFAAEANHLASELFAFLEAGARQIAVQTNRKGDGQVKLKLEPHIIAALDNFMAEDNRINSRPQAISMILNSALMEHGFLIDERREAS